MEENVIHEPGGATVTPVRREQAVSAPNARPAPHRLSLPRPTMRTLIAEVQVTQAT